jgi:hypothetical protein
LQFRDTFFVWEGTDFSSFFRIFAPVFRRAHRPPRRNRGGARVVGKVVNWSADDKILTNGKVDLNKLRPVIYNSSDFNYYVVGDSVGKAWNIGNKYKE